MNRQSLADLTKKAKIGHISASIDLLQREVLASGLNYVTASNLAALYLQRGDIQQSLDFCTQAIALDPYSYIAYYNRFICLVVKQSLPSARKELRKAISCLYLIRGFQQKQSKYLNKAVSFCEQNARAYLARAKLNEGKNNKLAENDYSAAVEYDPNLAEVYQQRAIFYRSIGRIAEFEQDLATYLSLKQSNNQPLRQLVDNDEEELPKAELMQKIQEEIKEFQDLLHKNSRKNELTSSGERGEGISKLPLSSLQSKMEKKEDEQLLLNDWGQEGSAQTITIKKEEIQFRKRTDQKVEKQFREIFEDESSRELDDKIDRLQREIQKHGGKITNGEGEAQELDVSDPSNFLTQQIEKAIQEITKLSSPDLVDAKSIKSAGSLGSNRSEPKELTPEEFAHFKTITIEVVSMEDIQSYHRKELAKIRLSYANEAYETSMKKYEWGESFTIDVVEEFTDIEVSVIEKGGVFRGDAEIGEGSINLLERSNGKCIIGNRQKKIAILYFKLVLA